MAHGQVQIEGEVAEPSGEEPASLSVRYNASVAERQMNQCVTAFLSARRDNHGLKLLQFWNNSVKRCPKYALISRSALYRRVRQAEAAGGEFVPRETLGHQYSLTADEENELVQLIDQQISHHGRTFEWMISLEAQLLVARRVAAMENPTDEDKSRIARVGGRRWRENLIKRYPRFKPTKTKRPLEAHRAMKMQPEWTAQHYRKVLFACALIQIQRKIESGVKVVGWSLPTSSGFVVREIGSGPLAQTNDWGDDVLGVEEHDGLPFIVVVPLGNEALQLPELIVNGDEKPFSRDTVSTKGIGTTMAAQRGETWTVTPFVSQEELLAVTIIVKGGSVCMRMGERLQGSTLNAGISASPNGYTSDDLFLSTFTQNGGVIDILKAKGLRKGNPALLILDGHSSRLTRALSIELSKHSVYCVIMPSHTSTIHQPCDVGFMNALDRIYGSKYAHKLACNPKSRLTDVTCLDMLMSTLETLTKSKQIIRGSWSKVGIENGKLSLLNHFNVNTYKAGAPFRAEDPKLKLTVTPWLLRQLFHPRNLVLSPDRDHVLEISKRKETRECAERAAIALFEQIDSAHLDPEKGMMSYILKATEGNTGSFYKLTSSSFLQRASIVGNILGNTEDGAEENTGDTTEPSSLQRGASGRLSTAGGAMLFSQQIQQQTDMIFEAQEQKQAEKRKEAARKAAQIERERPASSLLHSLGVLPADLDLVTKKMLLPFLKLNGILVKTTMNRNELVTELLKVIAGGNVMQWKYRDHTGEVRTSQLVKRPRSDAFEPLQAQDVRRSKRRRGNDDE